MRIAVFSAKAYDRIAFDAANAEMAPAGRHELTYFDSHLDSATAALARGFAAACSFVNDDLSADVLGALAEGGTRLLLLRSAGFNHVDLRAAAAHKVTVARVPEYSPYAVAEHALGLILCLNRRLHRAYARVREGNFSLDGLLGFDLHGKTVGVVGTGRIGTAFCRIMAGLGCRIVASDPVPSAEVRALGASYVDLDALWPAADVVALHLPLTPETRHLVDDAVVARLKPGVMLINTSRGALVDTPALIRGLKSGRIGALGLDVYEEEAELFFEDLSQIVIQDDVFARLLTFPNVIVTGHQAFFTREALARIAETTLSNATAFETGNGTLHAVNVDRLRD